MRTYSSKTSNDLKLFLQKLTPFNIVTWGFHSIKKFFMASIFMDITTSLIYINLKNSSRPASDILMAIT